MLASAGSHLRPRATQGAASKDFLAKRVRRSLSASLKRRRTSKGRHAGTLPLARDSEKSGTEVQAVSCDEQKDERKSAGNKSERLEYLGFQIWGGGNSIKSLNQCGH